MEEAKKILYRLHKMESITDEELDILLNAINKNDGMFHYPMPASYLDDIPCRPVGDNIVYEETYKE